MDAGLTAFNLLHTSINIAVLPLLVLPSTTTNRFNELKFILHLFLYGLLFRPLSAANTLSYFPYPATVIYRQ